MKTPYIVKDINLAPLGQKKIDWVARSMSVLNSLYERFRANSVFAGRRIGLCIHLEAKTAYLALIIQKLGAEVWVTSSNTLSTKDEVCAALAKNGIHVFAVHGADDAAYRSYIKAICECGLHAVVDDGGDVCEYLHEHPELGKNLKGICEETTTGVNRLYQRFQANKLIYPALAINDAKSKFLFDNRYGTGQSTWTAIMHLTNKTVAGKTVVAIGYGWVGRGVAMRAHGLGAEVIVTERDPWKALEARMDGFRVMTLQEAAPLGDFFVTNTGQAGVIRREHFLVMKDGAMLANAGHFDFEIDVPALKEISKNVQEVREDIEEYLLNNGKRLYLLARGGIINIAGGLGHPIEILDLSFSLQLASLHYILSSAHLENKVYRVPQEIDEMVVREKLRVEGIRIDA